MSQLARIHSDRNKYCSAVQGDNFQLLLLELPDLKASDIKEYTVQYDWYFRPSNR